MLRFARTLLASVLLAPVSLPFPPAHPPCKAGQTGPLQVLPFRTFGRDDGLLSNCIVSIFQDSEGFLWFGCPEGISVYDGVTFVSYTTADGLAASGIRQVIEDRLAASKKILVLHNSGEIRVWRNGRFTPLASGEPRGGGFPVIQSLFQDHTGTLWAGGRDTLGRIADSMFLPITTGIPMRDVRAMAETPDGLVWFGSGSALSTYSNRTHSFSRVVPDSAVGTIVDLLSDEDGDLWVRSWGGPLRRIRDGRIVASMNVAGDFVVDDRRGNLWTGTYDGLRKIAKSSFGRGPIEAVTTRQGLPENTVKSAYLDREGNLWFGTIASGAVMLADHDLTLLPEYGFLSVYQFKGAVADPNGHLWVASPRGMVEIWRDSDERLRTAPHLLTDALAWGKPYPVHFLGDRTVPSVLQYVLQVDRRGRLWVCFSNSVLASYDISPGTTGSTLTKARLLLPGRDFPRGWPHTFLVDSFDRIWYGMHERVLVLDAEVGHPGVKVHDLSESIGQGTYPRVLLEDRNGNIRAGFVQHGVRMIARDSIPAGAFREDHRVPPALHDIRVMCMYEDAKGDLWIGTDSRGLLQCSGTGVKTWGVTDGLQSNSIFSVFEDAGRRLWICTTLGVAVMDSSRATVERPENLASITASCGGMLGRDDVWFVTLDGVVIVRVRQTLRPPDPLCPIIVHALVHDRGRPLSDLMGLNHTENTISLEYVSPAFGRTVQYAYRLRSTGDLPFTRTALTRVTYALLQPGSYTFEVKALSTAGRESPVRVVSFSIVPPFWTTWWFTTAVWISVLLLVGGTVRYIEISRLKAKMREVEQQRAIDRERLRLAADVHDDVGARLTEIGIMSELAARSPGAPAATKEQLLKIAQNARDAVQGIGEIIWATNPYEDSSDDVVAYVRAYAGSFLGVAGVRGIITVAPGLQEQRLSSAVRRNIFLAVKEVLANAVKHGRPPLVEVRFSSESDGLVVEIRDEGIGFEPGSDGRSGHGLRNITRRMSDVGGTVSIKSSRGAGTVVRLWVPGSSK